MSQPVLECVNDWENDCRCGRRHMPCWPRPDTSCCSDLDTTGKTEAQVALIERMLHVSTEILWRLSGKQFGACPVTVRPCKDDCGSSRQGFTWWDGVRWLPYLDNGQWFNSACSTCPKSGCSCSELCEITLPGPVDSIISVTVDGLPLDPSEYRVDNGNKLVRTSFGPLVMTQWQDLGGGVALATQSDIPAHSVVFSGGAVINGGVLTLPSQPGPFVLNFGLPARVQQRVKLTLEPWAELTLPAGWSVLQIQPLGATSTVFQFSPTEVRGGQFGGWVIVTGPGQSPAFLLPDGLNGIGEPRGGATVDYVSYVDDNRGGCWPKCQDMAQATTEAGTMAVTYRRGTPVPQSGLWAAGLLACELIKACSTAAECALPSNAQRIVREGVTLDLDPLLIDATGFQTGIAEVDLWLSSVNPFKQTRRSAVYSPDTKMPRQTTWPCV